MKKFALLLLLITASSCQDQEKELTAEAIETCNKVKQNTSTLIQIADFLLNRKY